MMKENENEKHETVADIVAEYRNDADAMDRGELYQPTTEYLRRLLDRIKAAWKREQAFNALVKEANERLREHLDIALKANKGGNAAAMREALREAIGETCAGCKRDCDDCMNLKSGWMKKAKAALTAPPRNCDVGTAEEQSLRMEKQYCRVQKECYESPSGKECPLHQIGVDCRLKWAQMPYDAEEGGAK